MSRISMAAPIVEIDGDEMTRVMWRMVREELLEPYIELKTEYYDLSLAERDRTEDVVTRDAANAIKRLRVGVKCATITPNAARVEEYHLHGQWKSPNGTIRDMLDGTTFRTPIVARGVESAVQSWKKPITIARHSSADQYSASEYRVPGAGTATLSFAGEDGERWEKELYAFSGPGVIQGIYNRDASIEAFARSCFAFALGEKRDLWFSAKDTICKAYDGDFRDIMARCYEEYRDAFDAAGIKYFYTLIDDAVARIMRSEGGMIWALKNYDGDVMSDMVSSAFGSLAMMTSVLCTPDGCYEYEAAHGTVTRHWYRYRNGEKTSTNPVATIFAWTGALARRGEIDGTPELTAFARRLERACLDTIEGGVMTGDLARIFSGEVKETPDTLSFIKAVRSAL